MTTSQRNRATTFRYAAGLGIAAALSFGALATAGQAFAEPTLPTPVPGEPLPPGQPVFVPEDAAAAAAAAPAPPPMGAPPVPEMAAGDAKYGSGNGPLGSLRDAWHQAQDPFNMSENPLGFGSAPPAGAGPAPALPPGYQSVNAPGSETIAPPKDPAQGPALPPGYYSLAGPPPPGYEWGTAPEAPPADPDAPAPYVPVHSAPPPPLYPTP